MSIVKNFMEDEIDLIIRMHRLLGNKWSLIAGRIPGRTANDIKNYFNTHLRKALESQPKEEEPERHRVVRPIPRYPTTAIGTGGPLIVSENEHHQLHHTPRLVSENQHLQLPREPPLPLPAWPEQKEDPIIQNNDHSIWWNETFKLLEDVQYTNENPAVSNVGESSGTGMENAIFQDSTIDDWEAFFLA